MENASAHGKNIPAAKAGRAGAPGALGQGPNGARLLVPAAGLAATEAAAARELPSPL